MGVVMMALLIAMFLVIVVLFYVSHPSRFASQDDARPKAWTDVLGAMDRGEFDTALRIGTMLADRSPGYYYGHQVLATVHLAKGNLKRAEESYARSYQLFPMQPTRERLEAVRELLEQKEISPRNP